MANIVSMIVKDGFSPDYNRDEINSVHSSLLILEEMIKGRKYLEDYATAVDHLVNAYFKIVGKDQSLVSVFKKRFQGGYTRGVYALILQDITDVILRSKFTTDFSKYGVLVVDGDDIKLSSHEYSKTIDAFNTKVDIKVPDVTDHTQSKVSELCVLVSKLGIEGVYYLLHALNKVVVVKNNK